ncbi:MAG: LL-diaminopimelate aminotransferase [candidate division TM6 bacterium GW2011_GWF2_36_6]|nr:MAG: LL-diaminopimelate aminotransferase [candidate division TM6 bacterium GW2011_GWF2_36_6]
MKLTEKIRKIPPYLFAEIDKRKEAAIASGIDIVDLGIGDPDLPTPDYIIEAMVAAVKNPSTHNYPPYQGIYEFRKAVADWYLDRFGVSLDPDKEVVSLIGSKEGIAHAFLTFLDPGDIALLPDPGYPVYKVNTIIAGGVPYSIPIKEENNYEIDFDQIDPAIAAKANLIFLNYPNNPTGAVASDEYLERAVEWCLKHDCLLCMDLAYSEVYYDGYLPKSILQFKNAKKIAIEFHSLSKTFNMTGWRIGMAVGNAEAIAALGKIKTNIDSGIFKAIQYAGITAFSGYKDFIKTQNQIYQKRRDLLVDGLNEIGWKIKKPKATFYIWARIPEPFKTSKEFTLDLLEKTGVLVVPGTGYGDNGEGYFRMSITTKEDRLLEAVKRLKNI